ncbi:uncharacterized protein LOC131018773 isoform X2 [Salvia miltiorrhiza]|uniref:uncharacterized protein LOC131018773 isoform X2 n=1 Tax=Salvia miltiorrhiza TaxID=226208 RepID=UPI0025ABAC5E|nr:uncharacterized protein LOC131018773 isoform X2 [Salvia miltiorrhiza]
MLSRFPVETPHIRPTPKSSATFHHKQNLFFKIACCVKNGSSDSPNSSPPSSTPDNKFGFKLVGQSLGDINRKFNDIDTNSMQESVNQWLSKTQNFFNEVTSPLVKSVHDRKPSPQSDSEDMDDVFIIEPTIDSRTPGGELSEAAIVSIEQFSRMNGLTGQKMQKIFKALVPESVYNDPRYLVEYCCFRFLSRNNVEVHPSLKEPAFRRLIFITMLAWENPLRKGKGNRVKLFKGSNFQKLVGEEAFVRIAPAVSGVADCPTAHNLFRALAGEEKGVSFSIWSTYVTELVKVHEGRKSYQFQDISQFPKEKILCLGSSRKQPVLKWENDMAWPGKVTLTDRALYFEAASLVGGKDAVRLDLTHHNSRVEKTRVGPLGSNVFDSAISITSGPEPVTLVLEFVDLGGEVRRDVWYAFISEVIGLYKFIREYGPKDNDESVYDIYGAHKGKDRAVTHAINAIARLQALQFMKRTFDEPTKLAQFSYLRNAPYGEVVLQTLAVNFWGGTVIKKLTDIDSELELLVRPNGEASESSNHVFDIDGSVYLRKWRRSASWGTSASLAFWKNAVVRHGVVLSKNLVVADMSLVEKASMICRDKCKVVEKTQATIEAAMIEGIPSNIDLFKELVLPLTLTAKNFERLRRWDDPLVTASFLGLVYTLIFRNLMSYIFPVTLMIFAAGMLVLKGLKEQGRLGRFFGKVTIYDQPPSNTIQKIIALKEAMREMEMSLQNVNVVLLKIRSIILAGHPQVTMEVALSLLVGSIILLLVPFKYVLAFLIFDLFTRELEFRRKMVEAFDNFLKERWDGVPAAPVVVLPLEEKEEEKKQLDKLKPERS